jgi:hypothetical protein
MIHVSRQQIPAHQGHISVPANAFHIKTVQAVKYGTQLYHNVYARQTHSLTV